MKPEYRLSYDLSGDLDDQTVIYAPKSLWRVLHYEKDKDSRVKLVMNVGWSSVHTKIDYNIKRSDLNQVINRLLAKRITTNLPIFMGNMWNFNNQEEGRCMPPYPWYWMVARLQYAEKNAGYRQWTTEDWKDLGERITQVWILVGKGLEKTVTIVIDVGQELLNTLMKVVKLIIDHWYVLLIVGTVIGTLIVGELTGFNGILRHMLKVVCCCACHLPLACEYKNNERRKKSTDLVSTNLLRKLQSLVRLRKRQWQATTQMRLWEMMGILVMEFSLLFWMIVMIWNNQRTKGTIGIVLIHMIKIIYSKIIMGDITIILMYRSKKLLEMFS